MGKKPYEAPVVRVVGSLQELTLANPEAQQQHAGRLRLPRNHPDLLAGQAG